MRTAETKTRFEELDLETRLEKLAPGIGEEKGPGWQYIASSKFSRGRPSQRLWTIQRFLVCTTKRMQRCAGTDELGLGLILSTQLSARVTLHQRLNDSQQTCHMSHTGFAQLCLHYIWPSKCSNVSCICRPPTIICWFSWQWHSYLSLTSFFPVIIMRRLASFLLSIVVVNAIIHDSFSLSARHARLSRRESILDVHARAVAPKRCPNLKNKAAALARPSVCSPYLCYFRLCLLLPLPSHPAVIIHLPQHHPRAMLMHLLLRRLIIIPVLFKSLAIVVLTAPPVGSFFWWEISAYSTFQEQVTPVSGPNGHIDWMNCGFEGSGWNPPYVTVHDIITIPLGTALQDPNSPFRACAPYVHLFEQYGGAYGIPAILLASFAMQESSCRPWIVGGAGEQGLMQITVDKCGGAPNGDCKDPVSYFSFPFHFF